MHVFAKNIKWVGSYFVLVVISFFLVCMATLIIDGFSQDFEFMEMISAIGLAYFIIGSVSIIFFVPLALLMSYGAGNQELSSLFRNRSSRIIAFVKTECVENRLLFIETAIATILGLSAFIAVALPIVVKIITQIQTPIFSASLSIIATACVLIAAIIAVPVWRRTGTVFLKLIKKPQSPIIVITVSSAVATALFIGLIIIKWGEFGRHLPWRAIIITVAGAIVFFLLTATNRHILTIIPLRLRTGLMCAALVFFLIGGTLFVLLPTSLDRSTYLIEDAGGPVSAAYSIFVNTLDVDGDGYLPWLAQGDCKSFDGNKHPGTIDIPNDGIDQDCDGKDADRSHSTQRGRHDYEANPRPGPMPVILITIDAVSALHMELYGAERKTMPFLTQKAKSAVVFNYAFSEGPSTRLSFPSLMSGRHNTQIRRELVKKTTAPWINIKNTIASVFSKAGYRTEAIAPDTYFASNISWLYKGFDNIDKSAVLGPCGKHKNGRKVTDAALKRLDELAGLKKFFLWVHYTDAHPPHKLPKGIEPIFGTEERDIYDRELLLLDDALKYLFKGIEKRLGNKKYIIAVAADHGHAFDPKHEKSHQDHDVSTAVTHIPLMFFSPYGKGIRSDQLAQSIDVMPTLLNMTGLKTKGLSGDSLLPAIQGKPNMERAIMQQFYLPELRLDNKDPLVQLSVRKGRYVLRERRGRKEEIYDFKKDPFENKNLSKSHPNILKELRQIRDEILSLVYEDWNRKQE